MAVGGLKHLPSLAVEGYPYHQKNRIRKLRKPNRRLKGRAGCPFFLQLQGQQGGLAVFIV